MTMYCFYQQTGGETKWVPALASERERIVRDKKPEFVTVLDVDNSFESELTLAELNAVKYTAPYGFYADFDSSSIEEVLGQVRLWMVKLKSEFEFDETQGRYFFTGSKGVHIEIPLSVFTQKIPAQGIPGLPYVFRELAMSMFVDTMDLRVYSGKRGRMWRVPNVQRQNGKYKVQVTFDELMLSTEEEYAAIVSSPRAPLPVEPPTFNPRLGYAYSVASEKFAKEAKVRSKQKGQDDRALERFKGEWPDSTLTVMSGDMVRKDVGWNQLVIQLSTLAQALGKGEDDLLEACAGLIENHKGDSDRYNTPRKREREMRNIFRYTDGNPAYSFSLGGLFSIYAKDAWRGDLEAGDYDPGDDEDIDAEADADAPPDENAEREFCKISGHLKWSKRGLFMKVEDQFKQVSNLGMSAPIRLMKIEGGEALGYELTLHTGEAKSIQSFVTMNTFTSRQAMNTWASKWSMSVQAPDQAVSAIVDLLRIRTMRSKKVMYTVSREGLDIVTLPGAKSVDEYEIIFATPDKVWSTGDTAFRFKGMHTTEGAFKSDLLSAPDLEDNEEMREFLDHLFEINSDENLGKIMGWFVASFLCQPLRRIYKQFPLLQVFGQAGSGKSKTVLVMSAMHYNVAEAKKLSANGNTQFPIIAAVTQSASMPVIFEEFKPREMSKYQKDILTNIMRNNYDGSRIERGALSKDAGTKEIVINGFDNVAPIAFMGEALESQSAILERCVMTALSKESRSGRGDHFKYVLPRRHLLGRVGKALVHSAMGLKYEALRDAIEHYQGRFATKLSQDVIDRMERPLYNIAVVAVALDFMSSTLARVFGDRYKARIEQMKHAILDNLHTTVPQVTDEVTKVLDIMAQLSRVSDVQYRLERNVDYVSDGEHVELKLRPAYAKYVRYQRSLGMEVLFDNDKAFEESMKKYSGTLATKCPESVLYRNSYEPLYRLSCEYLAEQHAEPFEE